MALLEICLDSLDSAQAAKDGGADRIELCGNLMEGGTTPSLGLVEACVDMGVDVRAMVRPRGADFLYSSAEMDLMLREIDLLKPTGVKGIVIGLLTAEGKIDAVQTQRLIARIRPLEVTFHRAFDVCRDPFEALDTLLELGVDILLTSGQAPSAMEGAELIGELVSRVGHDMTIMPGGGINAQNLATMREKTGARAFHTTARAWTESGMLYRKEGIPMGAEGTEEFRRKVAHTDSIMALKSILNG